MNDIDIEGLIRSAKGKLDSRDAASARELLERASRARPEDLNVLILLNMACRMQRDFPAALNVIDSALRIDPYLFVIHLSKGATLEELGENHAAAEAYRAALALAPPKSKLPPSLHGPLANAMQSVERDTERLHRFLQDAIDTERGRYREPDLKRFDECLAIFSGRAKRHVHEATLLYFPQLPAIPFYDNAQFPWLPRLEAATDMIREELNVVVREDWEMFHPYIQYPAGSPLRQWKDLNDSPDWSAFDFWRDGKKIEANCGRCPGTAALLETLPMVAQEGYGPNAMFSVMAPHTHIPPHTGSTNLRLIVHLPLTLPAHCRYRVGNDHREWKQGKAWVFDDTIEHEAWNDSDEARTILMFDVWNPLITEPERVLASAMMQAKLRFK